MKDVIKTMLEECREIQDFLEQKPSDDPNELSDRLGFLSVYMARSGDMLAQAKYMQDEMRRQVFEEKILDISTLSPTIASKLIESQTGECNYLVNWLDRINRTCVHQADSLRTVFSFVKENLKMTRKGY